MLKDEDTTNNFKSFCLQKTVVTIGDADLIIKFLCQTGFSNQDLLLKLKQNIHMHDIINFFFKRDLTVVSLDITT